MRSQKIWKYPVALGLNVRMDMQEGAEVLTVQMQDGTPTIWAIGDPSALTWPRRFHWYGTGDEITGNPGIYVGTVQMDGGYVFHLFDDGEIGK